MLLPREKVTSILPDGVINRQSSGDPIRDEQAIANLELALAQGIGKQPIIRAPRADWELQEIEAIVSDYFDMLIQERRGQPVNKSEHRRNLRIRLNQRSDPSIEFKHRNISAVLRESDLPWIKGYRPAENYQHNLATAVASYLQANPTILEEIDAIPESPLLEPYNFADFITKKPHIKPRNLRAQRIPIPTISVEGRDARKVLVGKAGEEIVIEFEKYRLTRLGRADLAERIAWVSRDEGDVFGYDIRSFDELGSEIVIEVKATERGSTTPFFLTLNELVTSQQFGQSYRLYRVYGIGRDPHAYELRGPLDASLELKPVTYSATLRPSPM
jgi:hypothetical protein